MDLFGKLGIHQLFGGQHCYTAVCLVPHVALMHNIATLQYACFSHTQPH